MKYTKTSYRKFELIIPTLLAVSLICSCYLISNKKFFWNDELFSYYLLSDKSFSHMLGAFHDKLNNTPILYFILGWVWDKIFGSSEFSLRIFSSIGMCTACFLMWHTIRRTYSFWITTLSVSGIFCTSFLILDQNSEARMYGLFLMVVALAVYLYEKFFYNYSPSRKAIILNVIVHVAIVHVHLFGPFYSAGILISFLISDLYFKRLRPGLYLSIIISWATFLFYLPSFLIQTDAGNPNTWLTVPSFDDLAVFYYSNTFLRIDLIQPVIYFAALAYLLKLISIRSSGNVMVVDNKLLKERLPLLVLGCIFVIMPVFIWAFSRLIKPIFWDRYMVPSALGAIVLLAFALNSLIEIRSSSRTDIFTWTRFENLFRNGCLIMFSLFLLWQPIRFARRYAQQNNLVSGESFYNKTSLPIVILHSHQYLVRQFYSSFRDRLYFILDWDVALKKQSGIWATQEFKHMDAFKRNYPAVFQSNVLATNQFLNKYDQFLVLTFYEGKFDCNNEPHGLQMAAMYCPQWLNSRIKNDSKYQVSVLEKKDNVTTYLVRKIYSRVSVDSIRH